MKENYSFTEKKEIRVFISSTFKDLEEERDYLITRTFPRLKALAAQRGVTIRELDLRWGITPKESKDHKTIEICLKEIDNSVPFFIGLLGDRYGWCPGHEDITPLEDVESPYQWIKEDIEQGKCVTEIEMLYGALRRKQKVNATFFIRTPFDPNIDEKNKSKILKLRETILHNGIYPVYTFSNKEEIDYYIIERFTNILDENFPYKELNEIERLQFAQNNIIHQYSQTYINSAEYYEKIDYFINDSSLQRLFIVGESGLGKTALIANWIKEKAESITLEGYFWHFVGHGYGEGTLAILYRLITCLRSYYHEYLSEELLTTNVINEKTLQDIYDVIANKRRTFTIIIDGINQLSFHGKPNNLLWLGNPPQNIKLVFSTEKIDDSIGSSSDQSTKIIHLRELTIEEREALIKKYLSRYGKKLPDELFHKISNSRVCQNTLILKSLLNEIILFPKRKELDARIDYYLTVKDNSEFFQNVLEQYEERFGSESVCLILSIISVSNFGLLEDEIITISGVTQLFWSQFYSAFSEYLIKKSCRLCIGHNYLLAAIRKRYWEKYEIPARNKIIAYFEKNISSTDSIKELPFQYEYCKLWQQLYFFLQDANNIDYFDKTFHEDLARWFIELRTNEYSLVSYIKIIADRYIETPIFVNFLYQICSVTFSSLGKDDEDVIILVNQLLAKDNGVWIIQQKSLIDLIIANYYTVIGDYNQELIYLDNAEKNIDSNIVEYNFYLNEIIDHHNNIFIRLGQYDKALNGAHKYLEYCISKYGNDNVYTAAAYSRLGEIHSHLIKFDDAFTFYEKALSIRVKIEGANSVLAAISYDDIASLLNRKGLTNEALLYSEKSEKILNLAFQGRGAIFSNIYKTRASIYQSRGDFKKEQEYLIKSLNNHIRYRRDNSPHIASTYLSLVFFDCEHGITDNTYSYIQKACSIYKNIYNQSHPKWIDFFVAKGRFLHCCKNYTKEILEYKKCISLFKNATNDDIALVYNNIGSAYDCDGNSKEAITYLQKALDVLPNDSYHSNERVIILSVLGDSYRSNNEIKNAIKSYQKAITLGISLQENTNLKIYRLYWKISEIKEEINDISRSISAGKQSLSFLECLPGNHKEELIEKYLILAHRSEKIGQKQCVLFYNKYLKYACELSRERDINTANAFLEVAGFYRRKGNIDRALKYMIKASTILDVVYANVSIKIRNLYNICLLYKEKGNLRKAADYCELAWNLSSSELGKDSNDTIILTKELLELFINLNNLEKCINIAEEIWGRNSPVTVNIAVNFSHLIAKQDKLESQKYFDIALNGFMHMKEKNALSGICSCNIAYKFFLDNQIEIAIPYLQKATMIFEEITDNNQKSNDYDLETEMSTIDDAIAAWELSYRLLSISYRNENDKQESLIYALKALNIAETRFSNSNVVWPTTLACVAKSQLNVGHVHEALNYYIQAKLKCESLGIENTTNTLYQNICQEIDKF